jgi:hypothetical protein
MVARAETEFKKYQKLGEFAEQLDMPTPGMPSSASAFNEDLDYERMKNWLRENLAKNIEKVITKHNEFAPEQKGAPKDRLVWSKEYISDNRKKLGLPREMFRSGKDTRFINNFFELKFGRDSLQKPILGGHLTPFGRMTEYWSSVYEEVKTSQNKTKFPQEYKFTLPLVDTLTKIKCFQRHLSKDKKMIEIEGCSFVKNKKLGEGAYGETYKVHYDGQGDLNLAKGDYALKYVSKNYDEKETNIQMKASKNCPFICKVYKSWKTGVGCGFILMELLGSQIELTTIIGQEHKDEVMTIVGSVAKALEELQIHNIIHRDIKAPNLAWSTWSNGKKFCKVIDFGLSKQLDHTYDRTTTTAGTKQFLAPEHTGVGGKHYGKEVDIWALGVLMYNLLSGKVPFKNSDSITQQIPNSGFKFQDESWSLIQGLLEKDEKKRITVDGIMNHDYFKTKVNFWGNLEADAIKSELPATQDPKRLAKRLAALSDLFYNEI